MTISSVGEFPKKLQFLLEPHRYKIVYGGRGGMKSENFAQALVVLGSQRKLRILCTRETQRSIQNSVHSMLASWIEKLNLRHIYDVQHSKIVNRFGGEIIFWGMQDMNAIKSIHDIDITWVEEAQGIKKDAWNTLLPTVLRKEGSELWVSFNPQLATDDTYKRFVVDPPTGAVVLKTTWRDNPWLTDELRVQKDDMYAKDRQAYLNVWEGEPGSTEGGVYADEMSAVDASGRICDVAVDRTRPVDTFWDLGYGDSTAIWFAQAFESGNIRVVDYLENRGKAIEHYAVELQQRGYMYGTDWLPHDGVDSIIHHRLVGDRSRSPEMVLRNIGRNVRIAPKMLLTSGINSVRMVLPNCWFDKERCDQGITALKSYHWPKESPTGVERREPVHDWASHGADAFRTLAVAIKFPDAKPKEKTTWHGGWGGKQGGGNAGWMGM